jgi:hypothetical protein
MRQLLGPTNHCPVILDGQKRLPPCRRRRGSVHVAKEKTAAGWLEC